MSQVTSSPGCPDPATVKAVTKNTQIPSFPANFQDNLPVAAHMDVYRPGWPHEQDSTTKTVTGK